jgi:hypothetical protein
MTTITTVEHIGYKVDIGFSEAFYVGIDPQGFHVNFSGGTTLDTYYGEDLGTFATKADADKAISDYAMYISGVEV